MDGTKNHTTSVALQTGLRQADRIAVDTGRDRQVSHCREQAQVKEQRASGVWGARNTCADF